MGSPPDGIVFVFEQQILYQIEGYFSKNVRKILYVIRILPLAYGRRIMVVINHFLLFYGYGFFSGDCLPAPHSLI
jgi:hypothetical protein